MSVKSQTKLSREDIAKIEIGHTNVSRPIQWTLTLTFLFFIGIYPVLQMFYHQPFGEWRQEESVQKSIKAYETAIEDSSLLRKWLLTPAQCFATSFFKIGNEKVIIGKDGWLFYAGDYEYLINPGFLRPAVLQKRILKGGQPDPVKAILDFNKQLQTRGIRLVLLPIPVKPMIYPDKLAGSNAPLQNLSFADFKQQIEAAGITVIDLADDFAAMRKAGIEPYLKTDTHWTPEGMKYAAQKTAAVINGDAIADVDDKTSSITAVGDIAAMLKIPDVTSYFPAETVAVSSLQFPIQRDSQVLLLGDSFANIYSLAAMNWGEGGGLAEMLGAYLGYPVDAILRNDAGAFATRQLLANELKRGRDRLEGKKTVVYEFAIRELVNGDWKMLDMTLGEAGELQFLNITEPRTVSATVLAVSTVPRPNSAPYKDHVMSFQLGDIDNGNGQALVYAVSMRDNVWTDAAKVRVGDTVNIHLVPWTDAEAEYGSWNRSEFDDDDLLMADPAFGILKK